MSTNMVELTSAQRSHLWTCIRTDDNNQLMLALRLYGVYDLKALRDLDFQLWKNGKGKGGTMPFGIMDVCCYNIENVPERGALNCLKSLLERYGANGFSATTDHVLYKCNFLNRFDAGKLISDEYI